MKAPDIITSHYVSITQTPAGVGERVVARMIDMVCLMVYIWALATATTFLADIGYGGIPELLVMIIFFLLLSPCIFYSLNCEYFFGGQSIGKRIMRIRVVMADGSSPTLGAILLRWVFMMVDIYFMCMGIVFIICTRRHQRLGDLAAGTMVIRTPRIDQMHLTLADFNYAMDDYQPLYPEVQQLSLGQIDVIERMLNDKVVYADEQLERLALKIEQMLDIKRTATMDATTFLETLYHDYQYYALQIV